MRSRALKTEREIETLHIAPETLTLVLDPWGHRLRKKRRVGDVLRTKNLLSKFVSKIEIGNNIDFTHDDFYLKIPSEKSEALCAHF